MGATLLGWLESEWAQARCSQGAVHWGCPGRKAGTEVSVGRGVAGVLFIGATLIGCLEWA